MAGIYVHVPFCRKACHYCDFHFSTSLAKRSDMVQAICTELMTRGKELKSQTIETVYFGGGTPSVLTKAELVDIFNAIQSNYTLADKIECTLEANPDDCSQVNLENWYSVGINRLSIGVQSFRQEDLDWMNRSHNSSQAIDSILKASEVGFKSINLDLIYGVPSMPKEAWEQNVKQAFALPINHISAYSLTVEKGTALHHFIKTEKYPALDEEKAASEFEYFLKAIERNGWEQYEISNYCKPRQYAEHNTNYWKQKPYIGVGPSAHSFINGERRWNISNNTKYLKASTEEIAFHESERLTLQDRTNEYIMLGLRTKWGVNTDVLLTEFGHDILKVSTIEISDLTKRGKLVFESGWLKLTKEGKLIADYVASGLFTVE
ncbi:MAG: oxygen-independent coproporphyrinogen-3 oxidase [Bacteroidia bacterium]|jgi:oxygen-independent coproporphyrinogen-3 oxidase